jgi:hypothetical protein
MAQISILRRDQRMSATLGEFQKLSVRNPNEGAATLPDE